MTSSGKNNKKLHFLLIFALCLFSLFVHRNWLQEGIHVYGEGEYFDREFIEDFISIPYTWQSTMDGGSNNIIELSKHPVRLIWGLLVQVFTSRIATFILFGLPSIFLPLVLMYWFAYSLFQRTLLSFTAAFIFSFNTYILTLQQGGQTGEVIAISLLPIGLMFFIRAIDRQSWKDTICGGLSLALVLCFDVRFSYLLVLMCIIYIPFGLLVNRSSDKEKIQRKILWISVLIGVFFLVPFLIHSFWILPMLFHTGMPAFGNYNQPSWVAALSYMTIEHTAAFYHPFWGSFPNLRVMEVKTIYWVIPLLVVLGIIFNLKQKKVWYLFLIALIGIILTKGSNPPFEKLYQWLFLNLPGFSAFRDPSKLYSLISVAYPPMFGLGIVAIWDRIFRKNYILRYFYAVVLSLVLILLAFPAFKDQLKGGTFEPKHIPREYEDIKNFLISHSTGYHSLYYPRAGKISFYSENHPYYGAVTFNPFDNFFYKADFNPNALNQTKELGSILGVLNIKYIVLNVAYSLNSSDELNVMREQLLRQNGLVETSNRYILENKFALPVFSIAHSATLVLGGMGGTLNLIEGNPNFFKNKNIIHIETSEPDNFLETLEDADEILFFKQQWDDLVLGVLVPKYSIELWPHGEYSGQNLPNTTLTRTSLPPHGNFLLENGSLAYSKKGVLECNIGEAHLKTSFETEEDGSYEVWLRVAQGRLMGSTEIIVDESSPIMKSQKSETESFTWINYGEFFLKKGIHQISINAIADGHHVLDQLIVVKRDIRLEASTKILGKIMNKHIFVTDKDNLLKVDIKTDILKSTGDTRWYEVSKREKYLNNHDFLKITQLSANINSDEVEWVKINPTKYKLKINAPKSDRLIFSATFDPGWVLKRDGVIVSKSEIVNGRMNSFKINIAEEGEYAVEYYPQRYTDIGLILSIMTALLAILLLMARIKVK